jgi:integrase
MPKRNRILKISQPTTKKWAGFLKSPTPGSDRASFAICERTSNGYRTIKSDPLDRINRQFKAGELPYESARILALDVLNQLRPKIGVSHLPQNLRFFERYWEQEYEHRDLIDRRSARNRLLRAVEGVGTVSLETGAREDLQAEVDSRFKGNKQRAIVIALNQLLKFLKRPERLRKARIEIDQISYVNSDELKRILEQVKDESIRLMHEVAFGTGMRAGEIFGIMPEHVKTNFVDVGSQIDIERTRRQTKNRKIRKAFILEPYRSTVRQWANIPLDKRLAFRKRSISKITRQASLKGIGREICFHDLRHSYAIHLISQEKSLALVAQSIGDSITVTERYYSGFVLTPESIAALER